MFKTIRESAWCEYQKLRFKDDITDTEYDFIRNFKSWDSSDCTDVGLLMVITEYAKTMK